MARVTALALDPHPLLGLDRLVEALAPAPAGHLASRELVDDDDLAVLDDVVAVPLVQGVGLERGVEVAREARVGVVQVLDAEELLDLVDALLGRGHRLVLEVDEVVAALLGAVGPRLQLGHQAGEGEVEVRRFLGLARDDQGRPGLVDEDVVDLVDDRVGPLALHAAVERVHHVVAQVVEPELVVGAVRDVRGIGLAAGHRLQVDQPLVRGGELGLEQVRRVVGDDADGQPEEVVDGTHPLRVAAGEVVVDGDDVGAAAAEAVEDRGQRRHEGLALAGPHLGDPSLVEGHRAHQLDVEVAHAEGPLHRLPAGREDLGDHVVEHCLEALLVPLPARLGQVVAALEVGVVELVLGRLLGGGILRDLRADRAHPLPDLLVGEGGELVLELVGLVDDWLEAIDLTVVGIEEFGEQAHGRLSIGWVRGCPGSRLPGPDPRVAARVSPSGRAAAPGRRSTSGSATPTRSISPPGSTKTPGSTEIAFGAPSITPRPPCCHALAQPGRHRGPAREQRRRQGRGAEHEGRPRREHPADDQPGLHGPVSPSRPAGRPGRTPGRRPRW